MVSFRSFFEAHSHNTTFPSALTHINKCAHPYARKQNRCIFCHSVAFSQLSAESNRIERRWICVRGEAQANVDCVVWCRLKVKIKVSTWSFSIKSALSLVCIYLSLARSPALWQRVNERAHTFYCNPDSSFIRRFMLNQDKFVVLRTTVHEYIFRSQSLSIFHIQYI